MIKIRFLYISFIIFFSCTKSTVNEVSYFGFLPDESKIIIKINDLNNTLKILDQNELLDNILLNKKIILSQLKYLSNENKEGHGLLSLSTFGKNEIAYTYIKEKDVSDSIKETNYLKRDYQGYNILSRRIHNKNEIHKVILDKYVITSSKDIVIENIIRNFIIKDINFNKDLSKIVRTVDQSQPFNIFSKSKNLNVLVDDLNNYSFYPKSNSNWIGYDFNYSIDNVFLTGVTRINDSINGKLSLFKNTSPVEIETHKIIPNSFKSFLTLSVKDSERFIFNFKEYLKLNDISTNNLKFNSLNLIDEISFVDDQEKFIILKINNPEVINNYFDFNQFNNIIGISEIDFNDDLSVLLKNIDDIPELKYSFLIDNNLIITSSLTQIKKIINSNKINDNIGSNNDYYEYLDQRPQKFSFLWMINNKILSDNKNTDFIVNSDNYPFTSFSGRINQDIALIDFDISKIKSINKDGDIFTEFFLTFDNKITLPPKWIYNHSNGKYDFVFQDDENYLYYYSSKGDLQWKKNISQKIIGEINQIDTYKNGRKQIIFRTLNNLYVLDKNGNEVKELTFGIESADINNPISIFDYDKNRNYRFLITNNDLIKMFDNSGKLVKGFQPEKFNSNILKKPIHIRIDGKDYILILLENGSLKILDRRGRDRIVVNENIKFSDNLFYSYLNNFSTIDRDGNFLMIDTSGKVSKNDLKLSENNLIYIHDNDLVYVDNNILSIKGISINLPFGSYSRPKVFKFPNKKLISITDFNEEKIYLYDENGKILEGFPLKGKSIIDIIDSDNDDKLEIITQLDGNSVVSYEIN
tara:strand:+ start:9638 stop:12064 length:2427 start_codon:yes stop_codon:yes gene_type:complete